MLLGGIFPIESVSTVQSGVHCVIILDDITGVCAAIHSRHIKLFDIKSKAHRRHPLICSLQPFVIYCNITYTNI